MSNDNLEEIKKQVEQRVAEEAKTMDNSKESGNGKGHVSSSFVRQCLQAQELGDGWMFAKILVDQFVYNNIADEWMRWLGNSWERDEMNFHLAAVEKVANRYADEIGIIGAEISQAVKHDNGDLKSRLEGIKKSLEKRVSRLRTDNGRNACVKFSRTIDEPIAIRGDELNMEPWLFGCANGVMDLKTGKFRDGRPDEYISLASPIEWRGFDAPVEKWEKFLLGIFNNDKEIIAYIQRVFGYALSGLNFERFFPVLCGQGRNGKDTFIEVISYVMGPMAGAIQAEMLLDHKNPRSSSGHSADIMTLKSLRLAFASETDEGRKFSPAKVKWLTGGGQLTGRHPYDKYEIRFMPTHTLVLITNHKPRANPDDFAFWERMHLIPFNISFVDRIPNADNERPAIKGLDIELKTEGPGILAWLIKGFFEYQKQGINPPGIVTEATAEYRRQEDLLGEFIDEHCYLNINAQISAKDAYDAFSGWFETNVSKNVWSKRKFGDTMTRRFEKKKSHGVNVYMGLGLNTDMPGLL